MRSGERDLIASAASGAQKTCAMSAPARSAAIAAKNGAPQYSALPPTTATRPADPLRRDDAAAGDDSRERRKAEGASMNE